MANDKTAATAAPKTSKTERFITWSTPLIDCAVRVFAALFFIATSYGYVHEWLRTHQAQHDLSIAGGIMVVSIALYLFTRRKR